MKKYTKEQILIAAEIGEISMIDAMHVVSLLDEAVVLERERNLNKTNVSDSVCDDEWHESNMQHFGKYDKEEFELQRLYDWLLDENREPANTKFTAGKTRNVAREIEFLLKNK